MAASDTNSSTGRSKQDWRIVAALWVIVGGVCVGLAHTLAASLL